VIGNDCKACGKVMETAESVGGSCIGKPEGNNCSSMVCSSCFNGSKDCLMCKDLAAYKEIHGNIDGLYKSLPNKSVVANNDVQPKSCNNKKKRKGKGSDDTLLTPVTVTTEESTSNIDSNTSQSNNNDSPESLSGRMNLGHAITNNSGIIF
jgi:hypothetical protein